MLKKECFLGCFLSLLLWLLLLLFVVTEKLLMYHEDFNYLCHNKEQATSGLSKK